MEQFVKPWSLAGFKIFYEHHFFYFARVLCLLLWPTLGVTLLIQGCWGTLVLCPSVPAGWQQVCNPGGLPYFLIGPAAPARAA